MGPASRGPRSPRLRVAFPSAYRSPTMSCTCRVARTTSRAPLVRPTPCRPLSSAASDLLEKIRSAYWQVLDVTQSMRGTPSAAFKREASGEVRGV